MALNPQYDAIGKAFVQQYYTLFDDAAQRHQLVNLYNVGFQGANDEFIVIDYVTSCNESLSLSNSYWILLIEIKQLFFRRTNP